MKTLELEILDNEGTVVRTYTCNYDETEGSRLRLSIEGNNYIMNTDGKLVILTQEEIEQELERKVAETQQCKLQFFNPKTGKLQGLFD